jgi:DNA topoisomerase-3
LPASFIKTKKTKEIFIMLVLTEKPSVAAAFAAALGVPRKGPVWENGDCCVVNALGHLLEDFSPEDYDPALKKWSPGSLPIIPETFRYKPVEKTKEQLAVVKDCFLRRKNEPLLLATDAEREGELIGAEILQYAGFGGFENARRFWVSQALTPDVILDGIKNAKPLADYASYKEQGYARRQADWLAGMNLTRLVSLQSGKLLTFGRVQTAVLGAVYSREKSIEGFEKEKYFEVSAVLDAGAPLALKLLNPDGGEFPARFPENAALLKEFAGLEAAPKQGRVTEIKKEKKTEHPPLLFNLTALQKEAHKLFAYSPQQTLDIAQSLYENRKCLSYPRTPSRVMGDSDAALLKSVFDRLKPEYPALAEGADESLFSESNRRVFNSAALQDHHALIPLAPLPEGASAEEANIYGLVLKQFFNLFMPDFICNAVKIIANIAGRLFAGAGIEPLQTGWKKDLAGGGGDSGENAPAQIFSGLEEKEYPLLSLKTEEKFTEPKKHYTFASILQLMENPRGEDGARLAGLGTPATRGAILQKLFDRNYLVLKGKSILPAPDGKFLIENAAKNPELAKFISIPETTRWEEQLHSDPKAFLSGVKDFVRRAVENTSVEQRQKEALGKCPRCGGGVFEGKKSFYCSNYKSGDGGGGADGKDGCRFAVWKETAGAPVTAEDAKLLLSGKQTKVKKCRNKDGKAFSASFALGADGKIQFRFAERKLKK